MWLYAASQLFFNISEPSQFILMLRPRTDLQQWVTRENFKIEPNIQVLEYTDNFGNLCQRLTAPEGEFSISSYSIVMTPENIDISHEASFTQIQDLPDNVIPYLLPSRYCESDRLGELACSIVADSMDGYDQVVAIMDWVQHNVKYAPGSSFMAMSAVEVMNQRFGVCRDLTHLCIALSRSISIPSRMVVGYLYELEPMDLHAWLEVFVGGKWYTFDPILPEPRGGRIVIAYGRDASDVAIYTMFGPPVIYSSMDVEVNLLTDPPA